MLMGGRFKCMLRKEDVHYGQEAHENMFNIIDRSNVY